MEIVTTTSFCVNCKHCFKTKTQFLCTLVEKSKLNIVTGEYEKYNHKSCTDMRAGVCGINAIHFANRDG